MMWYCPTLKRVIIEALEQRNLLNGEASALDGSTTPVAAMTQPTRLVVELQSPYSTLPPPPVYSEPIRFSADGSGGGIRFDDWSSDDLVMLIGTNESVRVVNNGKSWTVILPDDAILFRNSGGYFGLGFWEFEPVTFRNASNTASFRTVPSETGAENTYQVMDLEAGGFATRDPSAGVSAEELRRSGWTTAGYGLAKLAWIGDVGGLETKVLFNPAAPGPIDTSPIPTAPNKPEGSDRSTPGQTVRSIETPLLGPDHGRIGLNSLFSLTMNKSEGTATSASSALIDLISARLPDAIRRMTSANFGIVSLRGAYSVDRQAYSGKYGVLELVAIDAGR